MIHGTTPFADLDPYDVLDLPQSADKREVNRVYRDRMRGLSMQDKRYQDVQHAKEMLSKPKKRLRADIFHVPTTGWLAELERRFAGQKLDLEVAAVHEIALALSESTDPFPDADFTDPPPLDSKLEVSAELAADPVIARLAEVGP